jgi:hypothetical protein
VRNEEQWMQICTAFQSLVSNLLPETKVWAPWSKISNNQNKSQVGASNGEIFSPNNRKLTGASGKTFHLDTAKVCKVRSTQLTSDLRINVPISVTISHAEWHHVSPYNMPDLLERILDVSCQNLIIALHNYYV